MPKNNSKANRERRQADAIKRQAERDARTLVEHEQRLWESPGIQWKERRRLFGNGRPEEQA